MKLYLYSGGIAYRISFSYGVYLKGIGCAIYTESGDKL